MNMSMNMSLSKERNSKRKIANFRDAFAELTEMGQIIEMDYQNGPQYLCRLYKDRVAFNSYRKCLV